ncbi:MAG: hypothetical protein ACE5IK_06045 [Acidobacteriota bacterium]
MVRCATGLREASARASLLMSDTIDQAISTLNSLAIGQVDVLLRRLQEARALIKDDGAPELLEALDEAREAISAGDLPLFRKRVQHVVSRLGHLR